MMFNSSSNYSVSPEQSNFSSAKTPSPFTADRILIVDDSNQICSILVTNIIKACLLHGRTYRIIQSGPLGLIETNATQVPVAPGCFENKPLIIYTANCPRNALAVLNLPEVERLIIISDIMMPGDTEVGLFGLLQELAKRRLSVSLIFASSEKQNRYYVEEVLQSGKAYFMEKGGATWAQLPFLLVENSASFQYKVVVRSDYDHSIIETDNQITTTSAKSTDSAAPAKNKSRRSKVRLEKRLGFWERIAFWRNRVSA